ncbi:MAG: ribosomal protein S18-alanine N-acetyltransferase [Clostridium sp.]|nr:ribosomal protein S18-alanine N-acetyltransferase [Acetatifactor muris]MCM1526335.1 ribosomal protein S18-alanine N-acetyltransferase [Bacteroides sp.]MCM1562848.1 ribosomal protein S18-alanine N-acetyltransferase [Clostridium sp.]
MNALSGNVIIRPLRETDVPGLARIEREIFSMPWSEKAFLELLEHPYSLYMVAESEGRPIGCAGLTMLDNEGDIEKVMVEEARRGQGVGAVLLEELLREAARRGVRDFTLEVRAGNRPAIRLYEKFGFAAEGLRPNFYTKPPEDALIMWRRRE